MSKNINLKPWPPFKRSGTTIYTRTSGDDVHLEGDLEVDGDLDVSGLAIGGSIIYKIISVVNCYVATTGSDVTGDGTIGSPYLTIQHAIDELPEFVEENVTINVGAGTFDYALVSKQTTSKIDFVIVGSLNELEAEKTASSGTVTTVTYTGAGWTPNEFADYFLELTDGTGYDSDDTENNFYPIISNTSDTITIPRLFSALDNTTKFRVVELTTTIDSNNDADNYPILNTSNPQISFYAKNLKLINSFTGIGTTNNAYTIVQGCDLTRDTSGNSAVLTSNFSYTAVEGCLMSGTYTYGATYTDGKSSLGVFHNHIKDCVSSVGIYVLNNSTVIIYGTLIDNCSQGVRGRSGSIIEMTNANYSTINDCTTALTSDGGSVITATSVRGTGNTYISNTKTASSILFDDRYLFGTNLFSASPTGELQVYDGTLYTIYKYKTIRYSYSPIIYTELATDSSGNLTITPTGDKVIIDSDLEVYKAENDANPEIRLGASDAEELHVQTYYDAGTQLIDFVLFQTDTAGVGANKGKFKFNVDGADIFQVLDTGISVTGGISSADLSLTSGITQSPIAPGMLYEMKLETGWTTGSLIGAGFGSATTLSGEAEGVWLDFNKNLTATGQSVYGFGIDMPAVTNTGDGAYEYIGYGAYGDEIIQTTAAGVNDFIGFDVELPATTATTGNVQAFGLKVTGGVKTSGLQIGAYINMNDTTDTALHIDKGISQFDDAVNVGGNLSITGANFRGRTAVGAADYNPSVLTDDYIIAVDDTAAARAVTISTEDVATGSTTKPRIFIIKDESGGAGAQNITVSLESGGTIDGAATAVLVGDYDSITLVVDGTNGFII